MTESMRAYIASGTGSSASAISVESDTSFDVLISEAKASTFSHQAVFAAFSLYLGFSFEGSIYFSQTMLQTGENINLS